MTNPARIQSYSAALEFAERQVDALVRRHPDFFPIYTVGGKWQHAGELWTDWTGGFLAGMMWQFHRRTGDPLWRQWAEHYSRLLEHRQHDRNVHDLGFIFLNTYLPWYELTGNARLHGVLVQAGFLAGDERRFHTARPPGRPCTFVVQADPHLDENSSPEVYAQTLANELADDPDFIVDLGDDSMADKCVIQGDNPCARPSPPTWDGIFARNLLLRSWFERVGHSVPLFMVLGNHEGEAGWAEDGTPNNVSVWDTRARKLLHANPVPDGFYTGNEAESTHVGSRENYYAFEWGDALFVVIDPYWHSPVPVDNGVPGVDKTKDPWQATNGRRAVRVVQADAGDEPREVQVRLRAPRQRHRAGRR